MSVQLSAPPLPATRKPIGVLPEALVFGFSGSIVDGTVWQRWLWQLLSRFRMPWDYATFAARFHDDYLRDVQRGRREFSEAFQSFLLSLDLSYGEIDEIEAAGLARRRELWESIRPLPGVMSTLGGLEARGVRLALVADIEDSLDDLYACLARIGLRNRFDIVSCSLDVGAVLPESKVFRSVLQKLDAGEGEAAFVGTSAQELSTARRCGLNTIALQAKHGARADLHLSRLDELLKLEQPPTVDGEKRSLSAAA